MLRLYQITQGAGIEGKNKQYITERLPIWEMPKILEEEHLQSLSNVRDRIRTRDLLVRSQTLYPAELRTHFVTTKCILLLEALNVKYFFVN